MAESVLGAMCTGLQENAVASKHNSSLVLIAEPISGPPRQACSHPLSFAFIVLMRVAASLCPAALLVHVVLEWRSPTLYPCVQQYPLGANFCSASLDRRLLLREAAPGPEPELFCAVPARRVYAAVRAAKLAVSVAR